MKKMLTKHTADVQWANKMAERKP